MADKSHYQTLGVAKSATIPEIRKAYHQLARTSHPDRFRDPEEKRQAETLFSSMTEAFNILSSPTRRTEYDASLRDAASGETAAQREAKSYFRAGTVKLNASDHADATRLFRAAIHLDKDQSSYHAHLAQALTAAKSYGDASRAWDEAIRREPHNAVYHRMAGECLEGAGMRTRARRMYEAALNWDPTDSRAVAGLARVSDTDTQKQKGSGGLLGGLFKKA